jgi:hypothetical protein
VKKFEISKELMTKFLSQREGGVVEITEYQKLGSGWHGTGYKIAYEVGSKKKNTILRTLSPVSFSHDYSSDRAAVFTLQNKLFNSIPKHVRSVDVGGVTSSGELVSLGGAEEFFQIVEVADGNPYVEDLERIAKSGKLEDSDLEKVKLLSDYLADLHKEQFKGDGAVERSLKLRHLRDAVGHGEMLMGVLDTYPEKVDWLDDKVAAEVLSRAVKLNRKLSKLPIPIGRMHGDFHPGNIWFNDEKDFLLLDASREVWGLPADDMTALTINYIWYALRTAGKFAGPFAELFTVFWGNYLEGTKDKFVGVTAPLFFAFRAAVVAHPVFYPDQSEEIRKRIFTFILNVLQTEEFSPNNINSYLEVG